MSETPPETPAGPPDREAVQAYLGTGTSWTEEQVQEALDAERDAQAKVCRVPADDVVWPHDLREALKRRVAANLALRGLPLGVQVDLTDSAVAATRVGANAEVTRLERPYRKLVLG